MISQRVNCVRAKGQWPAMAGRYLILERAGDQLAVPLRAGASWPILAPPLLASAATGPRDQGIAAGGRRKRHDRQVNMRVRRERQHQQQSGLHAKFAQRSMQPQACTRRKKVKGSESRATKRPSLSLAASLTKVWLECRKGRCDLFRDRMPENATNEAGERHHISD